MKNWLSDKTILITGGTSGLGKSLVSEFLEMGCHVISIARNGAVVEINNDNYKHFSSDFSNLSTIKEIVEEFIKEKILVDVLINNAGVLSPPRYEESTDGFELSYQVNFLSHVYLTRLLLKHNLLNPDLIANISSPIHTKGHMNLDKALDQKLMDFSRHILIRNFIWPCLANGYQKKGILALVSILGLLTLGFINFRISGFIRCTK